MHKTLLLKNEYIEDVKVYDKNSVYAGKLTLTPKECYIEIFTEREPSEFFYASKNLECHSMNEGYLLYGLKLLHMTHTFLEAQELDMFCSVSIKFEIQYVLFINGFLPSLDSKIKSLSINSNFIKKWTMHTETQKQILENYLKKEGFAAYSGTEFEQEIQNYGHIGIYYSPTQFTSIEELNSGIKIHPQLTIHYKDRLDFSMIFDEFNKLYQLLTLFNGGDFKIDFIEFEFDEWNSKPAYLYYSSSQKIDELNFVLLPLGKDLIFSDQGLIPLPLNFFDIYYNLPQAKQELFKRYLKYKQIASLEEKFLGYFRLLEKITHKTKNYVDNKALTQLLERSKKYVAKKLNTNSRTIKDFNSRIERLNTSKYNTEKCICDFYETIPSQIKDQLECTKSELSDITKLRNNITHANDYVIDDRTLYKYTSFINSLLFLAITNIFLEIPLETCIPVARRLDSF
ncbi:hypothetical protein NRA19_14240 [Acinetobacter baumannii]|nr:hypothetical protein [Acinetobacter baumannii]MDC5176935.1 hypothetical protein [Acinetobacter baumannii]